MKYIVNGELTADKVREIVNHWAVNELPKLKKKWNYYIGVQEISRKVYSDETKPCNKITVNFCHQITQQYLGFNVGIPVTYEVDDAVMDFLNYNDVTDKDTLLLRNALIYGKSFELQYIDDDKKERFEVTDTQCGIDIYSNELDQDELKAFVRFYIEENTGVKAGQEWLCDVYDSEKISTYRAASDFSTLEPVEVVPHNFNQVPVVVFSLNQEEQGIFEQIMSLQDSYNTLLSSEVDDYEAFVDAYMVLKGVTAEDEDIKKMKVNRVLVLDNDAGAEYLTKEVNDAQIQNMLNNVKDMIFKISNSPDFSDPTFMSDSGIALEYKLVGFNNVSHAIMNRMEKALRKRIELFEGIETLKGTENFADVVIRFTQNIPANTLDTANTINLLRGLVSKETLLSLLPFVKDAHAEVEQAKKEQEEENKLYDFNYGNESDN